MPSKEGYKPSSFIYNSDKPVAPWERWEVLSPSCYGWGKRERDEVLDVGSWQELDSPV